MRISSRFYWMLLIAPLALPACTSTQRAADDAHASSSPHLAIPEEALRYYPGRYRYNAETGFKIERRGKRLFLEDFGGAPRELQYMGDGRYQCAETATPITFSTVTERSPSWVHTTATLHVMLDDGSRRTHHPIPVDEITPREVLLEEGYEAALPVYRALLNESPDAAHISEQWLIESGLAMASAGQLEPAIGLLRIATDLYPESANSYNAVGDVYLQMNWPHAAQTWYHKALEVDPDFPSALKAVAELQAERTRRENERTTAASAGRVALTLRIWIDGTVLVRVRENKVWLEHISHALPGTWVTDADHSASRPTFINEFEWLPEWNGRISNAFTVEDGIWPLDVWHVAIYEVNARGRVIKVEQASEDNNFTSTLMLDDDEYPGAAWYEVQLSW